MGFLRCHPRGILRLGNWLLRLTVTALRLTGLSWKMQGRAFIHSSGLAYREEMSPKFCSLTTEEYRLVGQLLALSVTRERPGRVPWVMTATGPGEGA